MVAGRHAAGIGPAVIGGSSGGRGCHSRRKRRGTVGSVRWTADVLGWWAVLALVGQMRMRRVMAMRREVLGVGSGVALRDDGPLLLWVHHLPG